MSEPEKAIFDYLHLYTHPNRAVDKFTF